MSKYTCSLFALSLTAVAGSALAQNASTDPVSRAEYEKLHQEVVDLKARIATESTEPDKSAQPDTELRLDALERASEDLKKGDSSFHLGGFAFAGFRDADDENSTFSSGLAPVILWQVNDKLLFEAEIEFELESGGDHGGGTEVELEYANGSYILNDYITVGAGKFLTPFGIFGERLHPVWINKLPNAPLPYAHHDGIAPMSSIGFFVRGGAPLGSMKGNYSFYISNGPSLETEHHDAGNLNFSNFDDSNQGKAIGGRLGLIPHNGVEVGYSFQFAGVGGSEFGQDVDALLQAIDLSYVKNSNAIKGVIDCRFEWVFSDVGDATFYDEHDDEYFTFDNKRNGGYAQLAYRPTQIEGDVIKNFEIVGRFDRLDFGSEVAEEDKDRWSIGLNYWFTNSSVLKVSYQTTSVEDEDDTNALLAQVGFGF